MRKKMLAKTLAAFLSIGVLPAVVPDVGISYCEAASVAQVYDLNFDASIGIEKTLTCNGQAVRFVAYENIVYVRNPKNVERQSLSIYVSAEYLRGGYMTGEILAPSEKNFGKDSPNASLFALSRGLVVVSPAIRGRTTVTDGVYVGKAPALIVDYKAAVRYLRFNRNRLPAGDTEKIISNGTSAGGALSAALGSTGNAHEFESYLEEIGAATERDDIFASSDYCPITNLENADKDTPLAIPAILALTLQNNGVDVDFFSP